MDEEFSTSFALAEEETLATALEAFDAAREHYLAQVAVLEPGGQFRTPPGPWFGSYESSDAVWR